MDKYENVRSLSFPALAGALGIDMARFKRRKQDWQGFCPIHQSKTNNNCFAYSDDGKFHCFSCNAKGRGGIDLAMQVKGVKFQEAVAFLEPLAGKEVQTPSSPAIASPEPNSGVLQPLEKDTWRKFQVPCEWLEKRIPDSAVRERYGVFCYNNPARRSAYSGRVMLPVKDVNGQLFGYLGRTIDASVEPKYLFPKNLPKSRFLFGAHELWECRPHRIVYLVESPFCVMKLAAYGLAAVAAYGWSVSEQQAKILGQLARGVVYLPDANKYQESAGCLPLLAPSLWVRFPRLPDGCQDPEQLDKEALLNLTK